MHTQIPLDRVVLWRGCAPSCPAFLPASHLVSQSHSGLGASLSPVFAGLDFRRPPPIQAWRPFSPVDGAACRPQAAGLATRRRLPSIELAALNRCASADAGSPAHYIAGLYSPYALSSPTEHLAKHCRTRAWITQGMPQICHNGCAKHRHAKQNSASHCTCKTLF